MKPNYSKLLQDPRWQRKRLEIFQRDNWACSFCGRTEDTLHVHHDYYRGNPWDVPSESLWTCCERCHKYLEHFKAMAKKCCPAKKLSAWDLVGAAVRASDASGLEDYSDWRLQMAMWMELYRLK